MKFLIEIDKDTHDVNIVLIGNGLQLVAMLTLAMAENENIENLINLASQSFNHVKNG